MNSVERLSAVFGRSNVDHTPILGGWIACPEHICALAGIDEDTYWTDPIGHSIRAYEVLGSDGLIDVFVPKHRSDFRCVDSDTYQHANTGRSLEEAAAYVDELPEAEQIEDEFDFATEYAAFAAALVHGRSLTGDMEWLPAQWSAAARVNWYGELGYENFFGIVGLYEDKAAKLMRVGGAKGYCRSRLIAQAVVEGLYPKAMLFGEDICTHRGPMISPEFMKRHYAPQLARGLQPLLDVGCNPIWHSDGDIRQIIDMLIDCGVQGFQGFQPECGMKIEDIVKLKTREGRDLIIFGPLSVTGELPRMNPHQVRDRVVEVTGICSGQAHLVLFTANTINPDVPLSNIIAMHEAAKH